jgi:glutaconate CoA-transferase, subunit B
MSTDLPAVDGVPMDAFMSCVMSRQVRNEDWVSHGASVPLAGAALFGAMETHAPDADVWIQGCVTPSDRNLADALLFPTRIYGATKAHMSQTQIINFSLRGNSTFQFLRPAQIDPHGNLNVSVIERGDKPDLRFHGIAIGDALNAVGRVCFYVTEHTPRTFVAELPFRTATGHDDGSAWREGTGLPPEAGPVGAVTPMAVLDFDEGRRLRIASVHRGFTVEDVQAASGFELGVAPDCGETPMPTAEELAALEKVDPEGIRRLEFRETRAEVLAHLAERARQGA